jgi:centromere protein B
MFQLKKHVRTLHDRLKVIEEIENNPEEKRVDIAERLGMPASTLNSIYARKWEIREHIKKLGNACKKRKNCKKPTYDELETVLLSWYQRSRALNIPIDGHELRKTAKTIADRMNIDNFSSSIGWLYRFRARHGLDFKKFKGKSAEVSKEY